MSPAEYLRAVRVLRARQLLLDGAPIARVAAEGGFADQAHFTRCFRRAFGYTPGDVVRATHQRVLSKDDERRA
jgi:transcriptional regulator GlxA family with amidase domain